MKIQSVTASTLAALTAMSCFSLSIMAHAEAPPQLSSQSSVAVDCDYSFSWVERNPEEGGKIVSSNTNANSNSDAAKLTSDQLVVQSDGLLFSQTRDVHSVEYFSSSQVYGANFIVSSGSFLNEIELKFFLYKSPYKKDDKKIDFHKKDIVGSASVLVDVSNGQSKRVSGVFYDVDADRVLESFLDANKDLRSARSNSVQIGKILKSIPAKNYPNKTLIGVGFDCTAEKK